MAGEAAGQSPLPASRGEGFKKNRQGNCSVAPHSRHRTPGNGCGRGTYSKGKAETASRDKNVSGAADSGESRRGGTRAVSFTDPCHFNSGRPLDHFELSLPRRSNGNTRFSAARARRPSSNFDQEDH